MTANGYIDMSYAGGFAGHSSDKMPQHYRETRIVVNKY